MSLFEADGELTRMENLYARARRFGIDGVNFLDLCFDGGDSVDEASGLLDEWLAEAVVPIEEVLN